MLKNTFLKRLETTSKAKILPEEVRRKTEASRKFCLSRFVNQKQRFCCQNMLKLAKNEIDRPEITQPYVNYGRLECSRTGCERENKQYTSCRDQSDLDILFNHKALNFISCQNL